MKRSLSADDLLNRRMDAMKTPKRHREETRKKLLAEAEANLLSCDRLSWKAASRISRALRMPIDDARSIVQECLWKAALRYDSSRKIKYITFATFYLKLAFNHACREVYGKNSERDCDARTFSIDATDYKDEKYDDYEPVATEPESEWNDTDWEYLLRRLPERDRDIVELRYRSQWTLEEIAAEYGFCKERSRQIIVRAIQHLKRIHSTKQHLFM